MCLPKPYEPIESQKKKQYRPPVPTVFVSGFDSFLRRRKECEPEKDLAVLDVDEVLEECYQWKLISQTLYHKHMALNGYLHIKTYLDKWMRGKLS